MDTRTTDAAIGKNPAMLRAMAALLREQRGGLKRV